MQGNIHQVTQSLKTIHWDSPHPIPAVSLAAAVFLFRFHATLDFLYVFGRRQLFGHDAAIAQHLSHLLVVPHMFPRDSRFSRLQRTT
jgi:hypothetical protein